MKAEKFPWEVVDTARPLIGYMAFNHATNAMALIGTPKHIHNSIGKQATVFKDANSARVWIDRTIKAGRKEWSKECVRDGNPKHWRESTWKWLFRQTWSVVPVYYALQSEHIKEPR